MMHLYLDFYLAVRYYTLPDFLHFLECIKEIVGFFCFLDKIKVYYYS